MSDKPNNPWVFGEQNIPSNEYRDALSKCGRTIVLSPDDFKEFQDRAQQEHARLTADKARLRALLEMALPFAKYLVTNPDLVMPADRDKARAIAKEIEEELK